MKNYIVTVWILLIVAVSLLTSCEKDPWKFDTDRKPGLYFVELADTNEIAFDQLNDSLWTRKLFICYLIGAPTDYDRQIEFSPIDSSSNMKFGEDYKFSDATLKAGEVYWRNVLQSKMKTANGIAPLGLWRMSILFLICIQPLFLKCWYTIRANLNGGIKKYSGAGVKRHIRYI